MECFRCGAAPSGKCPECALPYCSEACFEKCRGDAGHAYICGIVQGFRLIGNDKRKRKRPEEEDEGGEEAQRARGGQGELFIAPAQLGDLEKFIDKQRNVARIILLETLSAKEVLAVCEASLKIFQFCKRRKHDVNHGKSVLDLVWERDFEKVPPYCLMLLDEMEESDRVWYGYFQKRFRLGKAKLYQRQYKLEKRVYYLNDDNKNNERLWRQQLWDGIISREPWLVGAILKEPALSGMELLAEEDLEWAMDGDKPEIIVAILKNSNFDPSFNNDILLQWALSAHNTAELIQVLLEDPRVDPVGDNDWAIRQASRHGIPENIMVLLDDPRIDPSFDDNELFQIACKLGYIQVVERLLTDDRVDPTADFNQGLSWAIESVKYDIVKLLLQNERVRDAVNPEEFEF